MSIDHPTLDDIYDMDCQWEAEDEWHRQDEKNNWGEPYTEEDRKSNEEYIKKQKQGDDSNDEHNNKS